MGNKSRKLSKRFTYRQTTPQGAEIPVPKRKDVLADLKKVAHTPTPDGQVPSKAKGERT